MGWSIGYDNEWSRDIGYGVPATCDHPGCTESIDRGLYYVCGDEPRGGNKGCGLFFCDEHLLINDKGIQLCERCINAEKPFDARPDVAEPVDSCLRDGEIVLHDGTIIPVSKEKVKESMSESWKQWRRENTKETIEIIQALITSGVNVPAEVLEPQEQSNNYASAKLQQPLKDN